MPVRADVSKRGKQQQPDEILGTNNSGHGCPYGNSGRIDPRPANMPKYRYTSWLINPYLPMTNPALRPTQGLRSRTSFPSMNKGERNRGTKGARGGMARSSRFHRSSYLSTS